MLTAFASGAFVGAIAGVLFSTDKGVKQERRSAKRESAKDLYTTTYVEGILNLKLPKT